MFNMDMSTSMKLPVLHILLALADGERHGYAIMRAVRDQSGGAVPLRTGSFYRHLAMLMDAGLVSESGAKPADADPRRGAYYRLTSRGRQALEAERRRLEELIAVFPSGRRVPRKGHA
jgi:DNA-binding PadR family transcriptional regulator